MPFAFCSRIDPNCARRYSGLCKNLCFKPDRHRSIDKEMIHRLAMEKFGEETAARKHFHTNLIKFFQRKIKKTPTHKKSLPLVWLKI